MKPLLEQCRTVVLASGSLAPIPSLCAELGLHPAPPPKAESDPLQDDSDDEIDPLSNATETKQSAYRLQVTPKPLEADHVIDLRKQLLAVSMGNFPDGSQLTVNYSNWRQDGFYPKLGDAVASVVEAVPSGGVLVFLPSYSFLNRCVDCWQGNQPDIWARLLASKGHVVVEPTGKQESFEEARTDYAETIERRGSCVLLAVFRGKMSEGISFNDANARCVVCVGLPFPNSYDRSIVIKKKYNDEQRRVQKRTDLLPGNEWYCQQAYRAVAQALGRCIRHSTDYGAIVLMDSRHCSRQSQDQLPRWMRYHVRNLVMQQKDPFGTDSIVGGWGGFKREVARFFEGAPIHAKVVLEKQKQDLDRARSHSKESWAPPPRPKSSHVTPPTSSTPTIDLVNDSDEDDML